MSVEAHRCRSESVIVRCAVISVSDSRTEASDTGGALIRERLTESGHEIVAYSLVPDDPARINYAVGQALARPDIDVVIMTGGTGIASRDNTPDVVQRWFNKELPGFGELFRMLSYQQVGAAAILSRATAGVCGDKVMFCLPGSPAGVELAMEKLILPELRHLVAELRR